MDWTTANELLSAQFDLNQARQQAQQALIDCQLATMHVQVEVEKVRLAAIQYQQAQLQFSIKEHSSDESSL